VKKLAFAVFAATCLLAGCADQTGKSITEPPGRRLAFVAGPACSSATRAEIVSQMEALFSPPYRAQANLLLQPMFNNCASNPAPAREFMLAYVQFTIDQLAAGHVDTPASGTPAEAVLSHWNYTFSYVGYVAPELPASVFGPEGAAGVITPNGGNREVAAANAAITVPVQTPLGDQRGHLLVIYPLPGGCLTGTSLVQSGPCFEFAAFPTVSPKFDPKVKVGICQPLDANEPLPLFTPALGHLTGGIVTVPSPLAYPTFCPHVSHADASVLEGGITGMTKRFARFVGRVFSPEPLYAVHGGLGGLGGGLSPFSAVDLTLFQSLLSGQTVGAPPTAEAGALTSDITDPGMAEVRASLGFYNDTLIVLRRKPGQCFNCGNLLLKANLVDESSGGGSDVGIYDVSWMSLQERLKFNQAPFVVRASNGLEIARVTYLNSGALLFNGVQVGTWKKDTPQRFVVRVNFTQRRTSLMLDGVIVSSRRFFVEDAQNLASLAAEFSQLDAGVIGWAEMKVVRIPDE
jgi:hypothetical protein